MNLQCNILHLEDDDNDSLLFERALWSLRFTGTYRRALSPDDAIEYLSGSGEFADRKLYPMPDVLVADGTATRPNLIFWLEDRQPFRPLVRIILTGGIPEDEKKKWLSHGVQCVLSKGSSFDEFTAAVQEVLRRALF